MCDSLCALGDASAGPGAVFAKNSDRPPTEPQDLEWHPPRRDRTALATTYIDVDPAPGETIGVLGSRPRWMWGMEHGVSEAGLAIGNEAIYTTLDPRPFPPALTGMDLVRLTLERADGAAAGVEVLTGLLDRYGQGGAGHEDGRRTYWSSFLLCDPGRAFVVETSGTTWAAEEVDRRRAISNRTTIPEFDAEHGITSPRIAAVVDPRLAASRRFLSVGPVDVAAAKAHLRSHDGGADGWTVCMHAATEATTASLVAELGDRLVAHASQGSPCRSIFVPLTVGPVPATPRWEAFATIDGATAERLRSLEAELVADFEPGPDWNSDALARVVGTLGDSGR